MQFIAFVNALLRLLCPITAIPLQDGQLQLLSESNELQEHLASLQVRLQ